MQVAYIATKPSSVGKPLAGRSKALTTACEISSSESHYDFFAACLQPQGLKAKTTLHTSLFTWVDWFVERL
jgi:hypothetical protein